MIERLKIAAPVVGLLFLAACAGQRPEPPAGSAVVAPLAWREAREAVTPSGEREWLESFGDEALVSLVDTALSNNVDISLAATRVAESRAVFQLARAQHGINLVGYLDGARQRSINPAFGVAVEQTAGDAGVAVSYDLDLFGRLSNASAAARANLLATEASRDTVRIAVVTGVVEGYIALRSLDARLQILEGTLAARGDEVRFTQRRANAGYSPVLDLRQAQAAYKAAELQIPVVRLAIARTEHALSILVGAGPREVTRGSAIEALRLPPAASVLPAELLTRRPDIAQAQQQLIAADRSLDASRAAFMPSIQLKSSGGWVESTLLADDPIEVFAIGGSILAPLFDSGRLRAQQGVAAARRDQAAYLYRKAVLTAFREVEDALAAVEHNREQLQIVDAQLENLQQVLDIATKRYRAGYSPYLEQLEAQRALLSTELSAVQTRAELLSSLVALYRSVGAGWQTPN